MPLFSWTMIPAGTKKCHWDTVEIKGISELEVENKKERETRFLIWVNEGINCGTIP